MVVLQIYIHLDVITWDNTNHDCNAQY